jgi:AraC-like DNA-binding protein
MTLGLPHWDLVLRGAVAGLLLHHVVLLVVPGPKRAVRWTLAAFAASVIAYLVCQQPVRLLELPRPLAIGLLVGAVASTAWMWAAARALFDDGYAFDARVALPIGAMLVLGLAANLPYFPEGDGPFVAHAPDGLVADLGVLHAVAMLGFTAAAIREVLRGWRDDLVAARRAARRWAAMGVVGYAAIALVVELSQRGEAVGPGLPMLHVAGIGLIALAVSVVIARGSLNDVLGTDPSASAPEAGPVAAGPDPASPDPASPDPLPSTPIAPAVAITTAPSRPDRDAPALARLADAMAQQRVYRREGLALAELATLVGVSDAALRELINRRLGFRNFNDFLHHHRLGEAAESLRAEDRPILSIALECGYGSIGPFNRAFRQRMGMTPTEYRAVARRPDESA